MRLDARVTSGSVACHLSIKKQSCSDIDYVVLTCKRRATTLRPRSLKASVGPWKSSDTRSSFFSSATLITSGSSNRENELVASSVRRFIQPVLLDKLIHRMQSSDVNCCVMEENNVINKAQVTEKMREKDILSQQTSTDAYQQMRCQASDYRLSCFSSHAMRKHVPQKVQHSYTYSLSNIIHTYMQSAVES